jgi:hypothetical protein
MDKIQYISLFLIFFSVITIVLGIVKLHEYPSTIAEARNHPQRDAIFATSVMGLIIFPLWMFALVWAYSGATIGTLYTPQEDDDDVSAAETPDPTESSGKA